MVKRGYYDLFFLNQKLIYLAYFILFGYTQKIIKGLYLLLNVVHVSKKGSSLKVSLLILHLFFFFIRPLNKDIANIQSLPNVHVIYQRTTKEDSRVQCIGKAVR